MNAQEDVLNAQALSSQIKSLIINGLENAQIVEMKGSFEDGLQNKIF
jgi:hypothetical protein